MEQHEVVKRALDMLENPHTLQLANVACCMKDSTRSCLPSHMVREPVPGLSRHIRNGNAL